MQNQGHVQPCCLFDLPGVTLEMVCIDVLHCLDLGVNQDILGNILYEYLRSGLPQGTNQETRVRSILKEIKEHQRQASSPNKLQGLTVDMIKGQGKPPKFKTRVVRLEVSLPMASKLLSPCMASSRACTA